MLLVGYSPSLHFGVILWAFILLRVGQGRVQHLVRLQRVANFNTRGRLIVRAKWKQSFFLLHPQATTKSKSWAIDHAVCYLSAEKGKKNLMFWGFSDSLLIRNLIDRTTGQFSWYKEEVCNLASMHWKCTNGRNGEKNSKRIFYQSFYLLNSYPRTIVGLIVPLLWISKQKQGSPE